MEVADGMVHSSMAEYPVAGNWDRVQMKEGGGGDNTVQTNAMTLMVGWKKLAQLPVLVERDEIVSIGKGGERL